MYGLMGTFIKENGKMGLELDWVISSGSRNMLIILDPLKTTFLRVMVFLCMKMDLIIKEVLIKTKDKDLVK